MIASAAPTRRFEGPTWLLIIAIYGGWLAVTWWFNALPGWCALPLGAWLTAWHMSLQHELIHGHPTGSARINALIGVAPLSLWLPYARYRDQHRAHHRQPHLTDPIEDPESFYLPAAAWHGRGRLGQAATRLLNMFAGRVLLHPARAIARFLLGEGQALARGSAYHWRIWGLQALGIAAILGWVDGVCAIPLWKYLIFFVYPGLSLASIRGFAEHRAAANPDHRTAIVERAPLLGLLFLHNNLHVLHHNQPDLPWYAMPARYREQREQLIRQNNGLVYQGYVEVMRRYLFREHDTPIVN